MTVCGTSTKCAYAGAGHVKINTASATFAVILLTVHVDAFKQVCITIRTDPYEVNFTSSRITSEICSGAFSLNDRFFAHE